MVEKGNSSVRGGSLGLVLCISNRGHRHPDEFDGIMLLACSCHGIAYISCEKPKN